MAEFLHASETARSPASLAGSMREGQRKRASYINTQAMNELLEKARRESGKGCVTVTMNTHRTLPENRQDPIMLKKLLKEAVERLGGETDAATAEKTAENLYRAASEIDFWNNLDSLVIFANAGFAGSIRLPIAVTDRVTVDDRFATKDLIRALQQEFSYYILVLSRNEARLIEAFNDRLTGERGGAFPMNNPLYTNDPVKLTNRHGQDDLTAEFFNNVDKALWETVKDDLKPVILATERRNYDYYMQVADRPELIVGTVTRNGEDEPPHRTVSDAWREASEILRNNTLARLPELDAALGAEVLVWGYSDIWNALAQGRGRTLFVRKGLHLPARIVRNPDASWSVLPTGDGDASLPGVTDDAVDDMVGMTLDGGGDVVFIDGDQLDKWNGAALIVRYALPEEGDTTNGEKSEEA